ncbi:beta catenin antagonist chibby [Arctopsyche grandis]|uniref:beta catenin antagonist chibby n=1 Tax=Arctopsyche grandis TaxID=121162 RepID=UPI00406D6FEF
MPLFSNKFSPKRIPARKFDSNIVNRELGPEFATRELGLEIPSIKLNLSKQEIAFDDGNWVAEASNSSGKDSAKIRKLVKTLEEENNLLKLKFEILLDMLTQTTAESQLQLKEIEQLKQQIKGTNRAKA